MHLSMICKKNNIANGTTVGIAVKINFIHELHRKTDVRIFQITTKHDE